MTTKTRPDALAGTCPRCAVNLRIRRVAGEVEIAGMDCGRSPAPPASAELQPLAPARLKASTQAATLSAAEAA